MMHYWESSLKGAAVSPDRLESVLDQHKIPTVKTGRVIINLSGNSRIITVDKIVYGVCKSEIYFPDASKQDFILNAMPTTQSHS